MKQSEALGAGPPRGGSSWTALAPELASPHAHAAFEGADSSGWRAELELRFAHRHGRTRLAHRWHRGPLRIQRPFYPANPHGGDTCQVVILHPPAGVVGGDRLGMDIESLADEHESGQRDEDDSKGEGPTDPGRRHKSKGPADPGRARRVTPGNACTRHGQRRRESVSGA